MLFVKPVNAIFHPAALDAGRILAATIIFYFHIGLKGHYPLTYPAEKAVEYFVMLSGVTFVLFSTPKPATFVQFIHFMKRRLASLFPMYLLVNLLLYSGSFFISSALGRPFTIAEFLASATGLSLYFGWKYMSNVMWFMPFILQVYMLLPLADRCLRRVHPVIFMLMAIACSYLLSQTVPFFLQDNTAINLVCKNWSPIFRLPEVCAGIILGRMALQQCGMAGGFQALAVYGGTALIVSELKTEGMMAHLYLPWAGFILPLLIFVVSGLLLPFLRHANPAWMRHLGAASFPFFLIHAAPINALAKLAKNNPLIWVVYYFVCWGLAYVLTILMAKLMKQLPFATTRSGTKTN